MAIVYHGRLEGLARDVERARPVIERKYAELLGEQRVQALRDAAARLLKPSSFFDDPRAWHAVSGDTIPEGASNKMMLALGGGDGIDAQGRIKSRKLRTTVAFYISERGFEASASRDFTDRPLASYVHEYDHFVWYVLQRVPFYLINQQIGEALGAEGRYDEETFAAQLERQRLPAQQIAQKVSLMLYNRTMVEMYEKSNRVLDKLVLGELGIDVPLPWRGQQRTYRLGHIPPNTILQLPSGGDPFRELDDEEIVHRVLDWERTMRMPMTTPYFRALVDSLKEVKVSRLDLEEFLKVERRRR